MITIIKALTLVGIIVGIAILILRPLEKYTSMGSKTVGKFGFRGTNRQNIEFNFEEEMGRKVSDWVSPSFLAILKRAGYKSLGEFVLYNLFVAVVAIMADLAILWFLGDYWWLTIPATFIVAMPAIYTVGKLQENQHSLVTQAPLFTSIVKREFARYNDMAVAFRRAGALTNGWISEVFTKMDDYLGAVEGDIHGALDIFRELNNHPIAEQFVIAIKQGLQTNNINDGLKDVAISAIHEKKKYVQVQIRKKDATIFLNVVILLMLFVGQISYIIFATTSNMSLITQ